MRMSLLREFSALARNKSYTKTAKELFMAPSTLSNHMAQLQDELGFRLIESRAGSFVLTAEGLEFLSSVWRILEEYDEAVERGRASYTDVTPFYVQAAKGFRFEKLFNDALTASGLRDTLRIETVDADESLPEELIPSGETDMALIDIVDGAPFSLTSALENLPQMRAIPLQREHFYFAVEPTHRLASKENLQYRDLDGSKIWIPLGNKSTQGFKSVSSFLKAHGAAVIPAYYQPSGQNKARFVDGVSQMNLGENALILLEWMANDVRASGKVILEFADEPMIDTHYGVYDPAKLDDDKLRFVQELERLAAERMATSN